MRLLFCHTTLAITTIVVLVSYATQTLAIRGGLTGGQNPDSYARRYMDQVAAKEGLSKPRWYEGGTAYISFARVNYNGQSGFMKCAPNNDEEKAFELLMAAREILTGSYAAYRDLVAYPLKRIRINTGDVRFDGNCYVYRYINGVTLEDYWKGKLYAERLPILNQIMPQIIQGLIYLYNAGIRHIDLHPGNIFIKKSFFGKMSIVITDFDVIGLIPDNKKLLDLNTTPTANLGFSSEYDCKDFNFASIMYIFNKADVDTGSFLQIPPPDKRNKIEKYLDSLLPRTFFKRTAKANLMQATNAFISLSRVHYIAENSHDCTSFIFTLKEVYPDSIRPANNAATVNPPNAAQ